MIAMSTLYLSRRDLARKAEVDEMTALKIRVSNCEEHRDRLVIEQQALAQNIAKLSVELAKRIPVAENGKAK